jgi:hypothetical protein
MLGFSPLASEALSDSGQSILARSARRWADIADFHIKQNDTSPGLEYAITPAVIMYGATVVFSMKKPSGSVIINRQPVTIEDETTGVFRYPFKASETVQTGDFIGEFEVTYLDGTIETFPSSEYIDITIIGDIA